MPPHRAHGHPDLDIYMAYNFFRLAAILQGILGRVRDGTAANAKAADMARQVRPLAETAWRFAERAGHERHQDRAGAGWRQRQGLAHIPMLEVFDEMGLKPAVIAGCSMGSLIAAGYAGGLSAKEIRERAETLLANRLGALRYALGSGNPLNLLALKGFASLHLQGETIARLALPATIPALIEEMPIPLKIIATDFDAMEEKVIETGPVIKAVAASIAIPGVILGPQYDGHAFVDGGITNPVPFNHVREGCDIVVAVDVTGRPRPGNGGARRNMDLATGSMLIMFHQIASLRRALSPPDIYICPALQDFSAGDFFRVQEFFAASAQAKDQLKYELEKRIAATTE